MRARCGARASDVCVYAHAFRVPRAQSIPMAIELWYLKMDIWILEEGATQSQPFVKMCGEAGSNAQVLYIGLADEHYQSLIPKSVEMVEENQIEEESTDFNEMKTCPVCGKECNKVLMHLSRAKACKEAFGIDKLKELVTKNNGTGGKRRKLHQ